MPATVALLAHPHGGGAGAGERAAQVHVDHGVEVLVGHLPQHPVAQDARVGDHHVEPAELLDGGGDQRVGGLGAADRGDDAGGACRPRRVIASTASSAAAASTSLTTTEAPAAASASAYARPSPRPLPVTTATFPVRSIV